MKKIAFLILFAVIGNQSFAQLKTFYVKPITTDANYAAAQDSHYVAINKSVSAKNQLLLFIEGTGSSTKFQTLFLKLAADNGLHAISIAYPNTPTVSSICNMSSDSACFKNVRQEVCYGTDLSSGVNVDTLNSINIRTLKLLKYLANTYPNDGWGQYFSGNQIVWSKLIVSGHSQGSGHALYFAKTQAVSRLIMFAGVDDYSAHFNKPAFWLYPAGATDKGQFYSFLHLQDDVAPYPVQYADLKALGMNTGADDSTIVDNKQVPYNNSHCLYTNAAPQHTSSSAYHGSVVVDYYTPVNNGIPVFTDVWKYMLGVAPVTAISETSVNRSVLSVYPNPATGIVHVTLHGQTGQDVTVFDSQGRLIYAVKANNREQLNIDTENWAKGIYFLQAGEKVVKILKE